MTWLLTHSGRQHYLAGPSATHPDNVPSLGEIAHALAHINRYTGHASRAYSVAEHSLLCMDIARTQFGADAGGQLAALMHDAHECICGDVASPIKQVLGDVWARFETMHEQHLRYHYGLISLFAQHRKMVKQCDLIALATERRDLTPFNAHVHAPWDVIDTPGHNVQPWPHVNLANPSRTNPTAAHWAWIFESTAQALMEETHALRTSLDLATDPEDQQHTASTTAATGATAP